MILYRNIPEIVAKAASCERVLDIGSWQCPFNSATHVLDLMPYETRHRHETLDPEMPQRYSKETWKIHDACTAPWPFPDKYFDFSLCSHLLEDVSDPIAVCRELIRVSKSGYVETPSRDREIYCKDRFRRLKTFVGRKSHVGFPHHNWFVEQGGDGLTFIKKEARLFDNPDNFIMRSEIGRKMKEDESGIGLFWTGSFAFREAQATPDDIAAYKRDALRRLTSTHAD
jgi:hypothetical protein